MALRELIVNRTLLMALALLLATGTGKLRAQAEPDATSTQPGVDSSQQSTPNPPSETPEAPVEPDQRPVYVPSLDESGTISLGAIHSIHPLFGATFSGGYDSNPGSVDGAPGSSLYIISPFAGLIAGTPRLQLVAQYHPTFTEYSGYAGQSMQDGAFKILVSPSPRLSWDIGFAGSHGDNSIRLLSSIHTVAIGGVAGSGSDAAAYLPDSGIVTNLSGSFDIDYRFSLRDSVAFQFADTFSSYPSLKESGSVTTGAASFAHEIKSTLGLVAYGQGAQYYGDLSCTTFGGGVGLRWQPGENTLLSVKGGPQLNSPSCNNQQGFAYSVAFSTQTLGKAQLYALADRQPVTGYLGPGLWQNDFSAGYQRAILSRNTVGFDFGFVQSTTLVQSAAYDGIFFDVSYARRLQRRLTFSSSFRHYERTLGPAGFGADVAMASLSFNSGSSASSW